MKKLLLFAAIAASAFSMNAQLTVLKSGNVRIGSKYLQAQTIVGKTASGFGPVNPNIETLTDSLASMNILGKKDNGANGYITFGNLKRAGIGEYGQSDSDVLGLFLSADANSGDEFPIGKHPAYLNIGAGSKISINALKNITSDRGIVVRNHGSLTLKTDKADLKGDKVEAGGTLNVKARQVTLEAGVTIEAGATANFSTY